MRTFQRRHIPEHIQTDIHRKAQIQQGIQPIRVAVPQPQQPPVQPPIVVIERTPSNTSGPPPTPTSSTPLSSERGTPDPDPGLDEETARLAALWQDIRTSQTIHVEPEEYVDLFEKILQQQAEEAANGSQDTQIPVTGNGQFELPLDEPSETYDNLFRHVQDQDDVESGGSHSYIVGTGLIY